MKRQLFTLFFTLCLLIGVLPATVALAGTGEGFSADDPMVVQEEGLIIEGSCLKGISQEWLDNNKPSDGSTFYIKVNVSDSITEIGDGFGGFRLGTGYHLQMDFSNATSLKTIRNQVALNSTALSGVLDLSNTKVEEIGKLAFSGCTGLTGVILPDSLKVLGKSDGTEGSVFKECKNLQFVRTKNSSENTTFELPQELEVIGKDTFNGCTGFPANTTVEIPESVTCVGSQAFHKTDSITTIVIRAMDASQYDGKAFVGNNYGLGKRLTFFAKAEAKATYTAGSTSSYKNSLTYEFTLYYGEEGGTVVKTEPKLYGQAVNVCKAKDGSWAVDEDYVIPDADATGVPPGYSGGWVYNGQLLKTSTVLKPTGDDLYLEVQNVLANPTVTYTVNGQAVPDIGTPTLTVETGEGLTGSVGVQVTHPLATEEAKASGTYVYFKYCWWDEKDGDVNGPRSKSEPDLFSTSTSSTVYNRVFTDQNSISIRNSDDARMDTNYYLVEIFGYYVKNGSETLYYKSRHNFIAGDNATDKSYLMQVEVKDAVPVTITPADMTIYMGGDNGYEGVVGEDGNLVEEESYNTLPEPLFKITVPEGSDVAPTDLTFTNTSTGNSWTPEQVENTDYYRLVSTAEEKKPIRVQFTDKHGTVHESDAFNPSDVQELFMTCDIKIFTNKNDVITIQDKDGKNYALDTGTGTLTVRAVENDDPTTPILTTTPVVPVTAGHTTAVVPAGTTYTLNGLDGVTIPSDAAPSLLFDNIIASDGKGDARKEALKIAVDEKLGGSNSNRQYEYKYLDLVDANNGNAWIKASNNVTIYWGYPQGTDENTTFKLVHFKDLHRDTSGGAESGIDPSDITAAATEIIDVTTTDQGITFEVTPGNFSPYVLIWEDNTTPGPGPDPTPTPDPEEPELERGDHYAYIFGYEDDTIRPDNDITRAEVATIFYRLLTDASRDEYRTTDNDFTDVSADAWYNETVSTLANAGVLAGYEDGSFRPDAPITRAEYAAIATRFDDLAAGTSSFTDISGHWAEAAINAAYSAGWVGGYEDGTFRPDQNITRAEAMALINRVLERAVDSDGMLDDMQRWVDCHPDAWYYADVQEATNSHDYEREEDEKYETWTALLPNKVF